jgi:N-acyl-D-glutamate deacylase
MAAREMVLNPNFKSKSGASLYDLEDAKSSGATMNWSTKVATDAQIDTILSKLEQGVREGALGVGLTTGYMVDGITSKETYGVQAIAGKYGLLLGLHGRFSGQDQGASGMLGTDEQLAAVLAGGGGLIVNHDDGEREHDYAHGSKLGSVDKILGAAGPAGGHTVLGVAAIRRCPAAS